MTTTLSKLHKGFLASFLLLLMSGLFLYSFSNRFNFNFQELHSYISQQRIDGDAAIPPALETKTASSFPSSSSSSSLSTSSKSIDYYNHDTEAFLRGLRHMGLEPAELHEFKSRHIITPHVYHDFSNPNTNKDNTYSVVRKAPGNRTTKIISFHNLRAPQNKWVKHAHIFSQNRDFKQCPYSECLVDPDGSLEAKAHMVWFICSGFTDKDLNKPRPPGQLWAVGCWESPMHWKHPADTRWRSVFNLTVGMDERYDINSVISTVGWRHRDDLLSDEEYLAAAKRKTKTAAWFVSHCHTQSKRSQYVKEMQKYIDVDIYGGCGPLKCPRSDHDVCQQKLNTTYKFYLSFENSFCRDYATDKFFGNFPRKHFHVVPVARSGFDYDKYFPKDSFVNAKDFKSAKELALYLKELGNDVERYAKMLKAKDRFVRIDSTTDWCDICEGMHTGKYPGRVISDAWKETHQGACYSPKDI